MNRKGSKKFLRDKYITPDEFKTLLETAIRWKPDMAIIVYLAGALGLSSGEIVCLSRRAFRNLRLGKLMVPTLWRRKHVFGRFPPEKAVLVDRYTRKVLEEYLHVMPEEQQWLFPGRFPGKHVHRDVVAKKFKELVCHAGLNQKYSFHCLRHYRGLVLWRSTKDLRFVRQQLRNTQYLSTKRYRRMGG